MKKMISKFADSLLSREDLKRVKGGFMLGDCCENQGQSTCNGTCGASGGTCEWVDIPQLGLKGCACNHS